MSEFDPYLKWLGIREVTRPINHYRLLGLDLFEADPEVISVAADRQMTHVRTYQNGPNGDVSQRILNELARARRCLLVSEKKQEYDDAIRASMRRPVPPAQPPQRADLVPPIPKPVVSGDRNTEDVEQVDPEIVEPGSGIGIKAVPRSRKSTLRRERKQLVWSLFGWVTGGLAAVGIAAWFIGSGILPNTLVTNEPDGDPQVAVAQPDQPIATAGSGNPDDNTLGTTPAGTTARPKDAPTAKNHPPTNAPVEPHKTPPETIPMDDAFGDATDANLLPANPTWSRDNLSKYPKPSAEARDLLSTIPQLVRFGRGIIHFTDAGDANVIQDQNGVTIGFQPGRLGPRNVVVTDGRGALLIGVTVSMDEDRKFRSVQPIFLGLLKNAFLGMRVGTSARQPQPPSQGLTFSLAKPGYAVGEIDVSVLDPITCLRIKFMRITTAGLDPADFYWSDWVGTESGPVKSIPNGQGVPVIGLSSKFDLKSGISSLRLVGAGKSAPVTKPAPGIAQTSPLNPGRIDPNIAPPVLNKLPEPSKRDRDKAVEIVSRVYRDSINRIRSIRDLRRVAQRIIADAKSDPDDSDGMYARFEIAHELGIASGDAKTAIDALRTMSDHFEIVFWEEVLDTIEDAELKANNDTQADFKQTMDELVDEAIQSQQFGPAGKLIASASLMAKRARNVAAQEKYKNLRKQVIELDKLAQQGENASGILQVDPEDAKANLVQGDYLFVVADDLDAAFECWRKSNVKQLKDLVEKESAVDKNDGQQLVGLAADWEDFGHQNRTARDRKCLERARFHCRAASSLLTGLDRQSALTKIRELDQILN